MKTLAYLKNIPIKPISSLQVVGSQFNDSYSVMIEENNGYFVGEFNNDFLNPTYIYLKKSELEEYKNSHEIKMCDEINYNLMYEKAKEINPILCHLVNPLYVKKIEVQNDKKDKING